MVRMKKTLTTVILLSVVYLKGYAQDSLQCACNDSSLKKITAFPGTGAGTNLKKALLKDSALIKERIPKVPALKKTYSLFPKNNSLETTTPLLQNNYLSYSLRFCQISRLPDTRY